MDCVDSVAMLREDESKRFAIVTAEEAGDEERKVD